MRSAQAVSTGVQSDVYYSDEFVNNVVGGGQGSGMGEYKLFGE